MLMARTKHREYHRFERVGWLRAAVLGANDGTKDGAIIRLIASELIHTAHDRQRHRSRTQPRKF